ncbi:hypothetical protein JVT61DRAFT_10840 [Boletus reticuloceps]|uniref:Uncharacterized protein n=1 Tax=Boletus reticuloceps TaxID=495285 RepID=A0A8I2YFF9_9AGAM|nr:hypothetical protein JVT61DRAFT_10840 [Boletus reticuloceps]
MGSIGHTVHRADGLNWNWTCHPPMHHVDVMTTPTGQQANGLDWTYCAPICTPP